MTHTDRTPTNRFGDNAVIGAHGQNVTVHDGIHIGHETNEELYERGENNLLRGAAEEARDLIWQAMMRGHQANRVLFHWLLAMLSGRTLKEFSPAEVRRLKEMRPRYTTAAGNAWAPGIHILSRLFDLAIPELAVGDPYASQTDLPTLRKELKGLPLDQQDLIRPHLEQFLVGPELNELWKEEVARAWVQRTEGSRSDRAWMYYQPVPKHVTLSHPPPPNVDQRRLYRSGALFGAALCFVGVELMWHGAVTGLASFVVAITGGLIAAEAELRLRSASQRRRLERPTRIPVTDQDLMEQVRKLFERYIRKYEPDKEKRASFKSSCAERVEAGCAEIADLCLRGNTSPGEIRWLVRLRSCQLLRAWRQGTMSRPYLMRHLRPRVVAARRFGLALLVLGGSWTVITLRASLIPDVAGVVAVLLGAVAAWRRWMTDSLELARFRTESEQRNRRQDDIDGAFTRWSRRLEARPSDKEMGAWFAADRAVLLDTALDHFDLQRSKLVMHALLDERAPWARAGRSEGGPAMYEKYQLLIFLLVNEGVRLVKASLNLVTADFVIRERRDFRYDSIVAVRVTPAAGGREDFELQLTSGDPVTLKARNTIPTAASSASGAVTSDDDLPLKAASTASTLRLLEGIAAEGQTWLTERTWNR